MLKVLKIFAPTLTNEEIKSIASGLENLSDLSFFGGAELTSSAMSQTMRQLFQLKYLKIFGSNVDDRMLEDLSYNNTSLKEIRLGYCIISEVGLESLMTNLKSLSELSVYKCPPSYENIKRLLEKYPNITLDEELYLGAKVMTFSINK